MSPPKGNKKVREQADRGMANYGLAIPTALLCFQKGVKVGSYLLTQISTLALTLLVEDKLD